MRQVSMTAAQPAVTFPGPKKKNRPDRKAGNPASTETYRRPGTYLHYPEPDNGDKRASRP